MVEAAAKIAKNSAGRSALIRAGFGFSFFSYQQADLFQILINLSIGLEQRCFVVGDAVRAAVIADNFLDLPEFVGGHRRKQVVFDLAGEVAGAEIDAGVIFDVAAGEHLFAEEIYGGAALRERHALMIGREDQREIEAEERLVSDSEENGVRETEQIGEQANVPDRVQDQEADFQDGMRDFRAHEEANAVVFQDEGLEQRQREERKVLVSHGEAREAMFRCGLIFREREWD